MEASIFRIPVLNAVFRGMKAIPVAPQKQDPEVYERAFEGVAFLGALTAAGGVIAGFIAWIGAVLNTWQLESKAWFVALLLLGIFNFGFFAMIAYLIVGPDGTTTVARNPARVSAGA